MKKGFLLSKGEAEAKKDAAASSAKQETESPSSATQSSTTTQDAAASSQSRQISGDAAAASATTTNAQSPQVSLRPNVSYNMRSQQQQQPAPSSPNFYVSPRRDGNLSQVRNSTDLPRDPYDPSSPGHNPAASHPHSHGARPPAFVLPPQIGQQGATTIRMQSQNGQQQQGATATRMQRGAGPQRINIHGDPNKTFIVQQTPNGPVRVPLSAILAQQQRVAAAAAAAQRPLAPPKPPQAPDCPTTSDITPNSISVNWQPPATSDEFLQATHFELFSAVCPKNKQQVSKKKKKKGPELPFKLVWTGSENEFISKDLKPGTEYAFRVRGCTTDQTGEFSEIVKATTAAVTPSKPNPPALSGRARTTLTLKWDQPAELIGGSKIITFRVYSDDGDGSLSPEDFSEIYSGSEKRHQVGGLESGKPYRFYISMENAVGVSPRSDVIEHDTTPGLPDAPEPPQVVSRSTDMITLQWTAPNGNGAPATLFKLEMKDPKTDFWMPQYQGEDLYCDVGGLTRATSYEFRLRAKNKAGFGDWSSFVSHETTAAAPGRPKKLEVPQKGPRNFNLIWENGDDGGAEILGFVAQVAIADKSNPKAPRSYNTVYEGQEKLCSVSGLEPGTCYACRVASRNASGLSKYSEEITVITGAEAPGAPMPPILKPGKGSKTNTIHASWNPPAFLGGAEIQLYKLEIAPLSRPGDWKEVPTDNNTSVLITDLEPGVGYCVRVSAKNRAGFGPESEMAAVSTNAATPEQPANLHAVNLESKSVQLQWDVPKDNGSPIIEYRIHQANAAVGDDTTFKQIAVATGTSAVIKKLKPHSPYLFKIEALSAVGTSDCGIPIAVFTLPAPPSAPIKVKCNALSYQSVHVAWTPGKDNGSPIIGYRIEANQRTVVAQTDGVEATIENLLPATVYSIGVYSINEVGESPVSDLRAAKTLAPPPLPPTASLGVATHSSLKVKFTSHKLSLGVSQMEVQMSTTEDKGFQTVYKGSQRSYKASKLESDTTYFFRARDTNESGTSEYSTAFPACTAAAPFAPPTGFKAILVQDTDLGDSIEAAWNTMNKSRISSDLQVRQVKVGTDTISLSNGKQATISEEFQSVFVSDTDKSTTITSLTKGVTYELRVRYRSDNNLGSFTKSQTIFVPDPTAVKVEPAKPKKRGQKNKKKAPVLEVEDTSKIARQVTKKKKSRLPSGEAMVVIVAVSIAVLTTTLIWLGVIGNEPKY